MTIMVPPPCFPRLGLLKTRNFSMISGMIRLLFSSSIHVSVRHAMSECESSRNCRSSLCLLLMDRRLAVVTMGRWVLFCLLLRFLSLLSFLLCSTRTHGLKIPRFTRCCLSDSSRWWWRPNGPTSWEISDEEELGKELEVVMKGRVEKKWRNGGEKTKEKKCNGKWELIM